MTPAELDRKVRRLDNDVQAIYELLAAISATQTRHGNRFGELDARFDAMDVRFDTMDARFDAMDKRFDSVTSSLDQVLTLLRER